PDAPRLSEQREHLGRRHFARNSNPAGKAQVYSLFFERHPLRTIPHNQEASITRYAAGCPRGEQTGNAFLLRQPANEKKLPAVRWRDHRRDAVLDEVRFDADTRFREPPADEPPARVFAQSYKCADLLRPRVPHTIRND